MPKKDAKIPPVAKLDFREGDLIIKEGDYGISIYEIISGKVGIYVKSGSNEINLAVIGPGEIIGEMTFLTGSTSPRTASARALEDSTLTAWHPAILAKEYLAMPPILKLVADQALKRLKQLNKEIGEFSIVPKRVEKTDKRNFYRKKLNIHCHYYPIGIEANVKLWGTIQNISKTGLGLVINFSNTLDFPHNAGDKFVMLILISTEKQIRVTGEIVSVKKLPNKSQLFLGISFLRISEDAQKQLGFFLMP